MMKLGNIKYGLTIGVIGALPMMHSCDEPEYQGVVVDKQDTTLYVDLNKDSVGDVILSPYSQILTGSDIQNDVFRQVKIGDTIKYITVAKNANAYCGIIRNVNGVMTRDIIKKSQQNFMMQSRSNNR